VLSGCGLLSMYQTIYSIANLSGAAPVGMLDLDVKK
jgi:hypothetical protein